MNEKWKVLTYRDYDFTDDNGVRQKGRTLHLYRKSNESGWPGIEYCKVACKFGTAAFDTVPALGKEYEIIFNRFGKVADLVLVQ